MRRHGTSALPVDDKMLETLRTFVSAKHANPDGFFVEARRLRQVVEAANEAPADLRASVLAALETEAICGAPFVDTLHLARAFGRMYSTYRHQPGFKAIKTATEDDAKLPLLTLRQHKAA